MEKKIPNSCFLKAPKHGNILVRTSLNYLRSTSNHIWNFMLLMWLWSIPILFLWGWTSINSSYFDVNYRGTGWLSGLTHPRMGVFRNGDTQKLMVDDGNPIKVDWLVVDLPLWKNMLVSWDYEIPPTIGENKIHGSSHHQPDDLGVPPFQESSSAVIYSLDSNHFSREIQAPTCAVDPCVAAYGKAGKGHPWIYRSKRVSHVHFSWFYNGWNIHIISDLDIDFDN